MPTEQFLDNLIINKVDTAETYEAMKANDLVNENEIYLIENPVANYIKEVNKGAAQKFWRGTKEEFDAITEKSDDTMYIVTDEDGGTVVEQVNADWNENNSESKAYIQNRPFGYYGEVNSEIFSLSSSFSFGTAVNVNAYTKWSMFLADTTYVVDFNGVEYKATLSSRAANFGYSNTETSDYPFNIYAAYDVDSDKSWYQVSTKEAGNHTIALYEVAEGAVKIGEEWLPDTVATKADIEAAIGAAISASY